MPTTAAELVVKVSADTAQAEGDLRRFSSGMLGGGMGAVFGGTLLAGGVQAGLRAVSGLAKGVVGLGADAISSGADFAFSMDQVAAVLGATDAEMAQLSATAVGLGMNPNLKVSTEEAATAMYSLATAGLTTSDIVNGAAEATVLLANATGGDMAQAGQVATDAMALWGMSADQLGESINGVVGVSNASKFDLNDYALAIAQGGGVAAMAGVSFEDFNATLAATSSYFSGGSDAGVSLKTMLASLTPGTKAQKDAMWELGLLTEDGTNAFYDATGELKGMYDIVGLLNTATKDLTTQKRTELLQTIFGNDAIRSAGALASMTADEYEAMYMVVNEGTSAMSQAKIRTDNLSSAWETFNDTIDAAKTNIGLSLEVPLQMAVKALTPMIDTLATFVQPYIDEASAWLETNIPIIQARIPIAFEAWNSAPGFISGIAAAYGELSGKAGELAPVVADLSAMDAALKAFATTGANPFPAFFAGIAASLTGGTAEFDAATGMFTAKWAAFQVEMSKTGEIEVHFNFKYIQDTVGDALTNQGPVAQGRRDRERLDAFFAETWTFVQKIAVTPLPTWAANAAATLQGFSKTAADLLNTAAATIGIGFDATITATANMVADWGDTWTTLYTAIVAAWVDWGETWSTIYAAGAEIMPDWGITWSQVYAAGAEIGADWGEVWSTIYNATARIFPNWGDTWTKAYSVTVTLFKRWFGGEPGASETGPLPDAGGWNASGTLSARGGLTWVGERGPELVALPGASRVWNNRESMAMAGAGGPQVVINASVADAIDLEVLARRVGQYLRMS